MADYQLPAVLHAVASVIPPRLSLGEPFSLTVTIRNAAEVLVPWGADELDYVLTTTGALVGTERGTVLALDDGDALAVNLDTSTAGLKSGTITISSDSQGVANGFVEIPVAYEVISALAGDYNGTGVVDQEDLDLVLSNWGHAVPPIPAGWDGDPPTGLVDQTELDRVLAGWGNVNFAGAPGTVPEPGTAVMVMVGMVVGITPVVRRVGWSSGRRPLQDDGARSSAQ